MRASGRREVARKRVEAAGLTNMVELVLADFTDLSEKGTAVLLRRMLRSGGFTARNAAGLQASARCRGRAAPMWSRSATPCP
jgi:hypothetical protein